MIEAIVIGMMGVGMLCAYALLWGMKKDISTLEKRVDFLTLLGAAQALEDEGTGDGEKDFQILIDRMDDVFGRGGGMNDA